MKEDILIDELTASITACLRSLCPLALLWGEGRRGKVQNRGVTKERDIIRPRIGAGKGIPDDLKR